MELVQVKIRGTVISSRYGDLSDGDILRTDPDYAKHLVDDCHAADYLTPAAPAAAGTAKPAAKKRATSKSE